MYRPFVGSNPVSNRRNKAQQSTIGQCPPYLQYPFVTVPLYPFPLWSNTTFVGANVKIRKDSLIGTAIWEEAGHDKANYEKMLNRVYQDGILVPGTRVVEADVVEKMKAIASSCDSNDNFYRLLQWRIERKLVEGKLDLLAKRRTGSGEIVDAISCQRVGQSLTHPTIDDSEDRRTPNVCGENSAVDDGVDDVDGDYPMGDDSEYDSSEEHEQGLLDDDPLASRSIEVDHRRAKCDATKWIKDHKHEWIDLDEVYKEQPAWDPEEDSDGAKKRKRGAKLCRAEKGITRCIASK